jgi:hypothetical protein
MLSKGPLPWEHPVYFATKKKSSLPGNDPYVYGSCRPAVASITSSRTRRNTLVSAVARAHRLATNALFRWRADLGYGRNAKAQLAPVVVSGEQSTGKTRADPATLMLRDLLPLPEGMTAIDLPDGRRVFAPGGSDSDAVRRYVAERETSR